MDVLHLLTGPLMGGLPLDGWSLLFPLLLAFAFGLSAIYALVCVPRHFWYAATATLLLFLATLLFTDPAAGLLLIATVFAAFLGWWLGTYALMHRKVTRPEPGELQNGPRLGHTAIVYFSHGETPYYQLENWILQFQEFDHQGVPFMPVLIRPFFFNMLRRKYRKAGKSKHLDMHQKMLAALEQRYRQAGDQATKFYLSFLDVAPHVDALAAQAYNEGASRIIISEVFLTDSNHTLEGEHQVEALDLEKRGVEVRYTRPLWDSALLARSFLDKLDSKVTKEERAQVGVLLVGHGQPDEWDVEFPTETEHENRSRENVMDLLIANGYAKENISLAWMSFKHPTPTEMIDEMARRGVKKVFFFSSAISAEGIHSQVDIPELVEKAKAAQGMDIVDLGAWNDHPLVIAAIKERVDEAMNGGGRTRGSSKQL